MKKRAATHLPRPVAKRRTAKRAGSITKVERDAIKALVLDQPTELTPRQIEGLATGMRRSPAVIKQLVQEAREDFAGAAKTYVQIHQDATASALAAREFSTAGKLAAWALTNIAAEGTRVIDKPDTAPTGAKILIGIAVGGINKHAVEIPIEATVEDVEVSAG